jgi:hypothetical protein
MRRGLNTFLAIVQKAHVVDSFELGWIVGILDGEGTFTSQYSKYKAGKRYFPKVGLGMTDRDTVERYLKFINTNFLPKPNKRGVTSAGPLSVYTELRPPHKPIYRVLLTNQRAEALMDLVYPHLSLRRRSQIDAIKQLCVWPRPDPSLGNCSKGTCGG